LCFFTFKDTTNVFIFFTSESDTHPAGLRPRASPHLFCEHTREFAHFSSCMGWETRLYARIKHVNA